MTTGQARLPRYDERLREAKNKGKHIRLILGGDCMPYTDDDCAIVGKIEEVDKFTLGLTIDDQGSERFIWISKSAIVCTEILA